MSFMQWSSNLYICNLFNAYIQTIMVRMQVKINEMAFDFNNFELGSFVAWLEDTRARTFHRVPLSMPAGFSGAWFTDEELPYEYILFNCNLPAPQRQFVQLHELSHFLCGHQTVYITEKRLGQLKHELRSISDRNALLPNLSERKLREEIEAELLAFLIQQRVNTNSAFQV